MGGASQRQRHKHDGDWLRVPHTSTIFAHMGFFKKAERSPEEQARRNEQAEQARAERQQRADEALAERREKLRTNAFKLSLAKRDKFPVDGARLFLLSGFLGSQCLVIRDDQVEYYTKEMGTAFSGTTEVKLQWLAPASAIKSVTCDPPAPDDVPAAAGTKSTLSVVTDVGSMSMKEGSLPANYGAELLKEMKDRAGGALTEDPASALSTSPREALQELSALFEDGLITDEDFQAKKADILSRM